MLKVLFCIFALSVTLVASCGEACANNGDCTDTLCTYCQNGATCIDGMKCGSPCEVTTDCSHSCSVCAPTNSNPTAKICQPACNQTCGSDADCQGGNFNGGCGSCISGTCQPTVTTPPAPPPPPPSVQCGAVCTDTSECPASCSVCAPHGPAPPGQNATLYCQPACNQTCGSDADCFLPYNGGCGSCMNGLCQRFNPGPPPPPPIVACGAACGTPFNCPATCSVCAPEGPAPPGQNATTYCQPACNQTCGSAKDCFGAYNGGCGNCVNGKCTTGKICGVACMQDSECGSFGFPYCTKCVAGKCSGTCGTKCITDGNCDPSSTCPRCASGVCGAAQSCGGQCQVDQDCPGPVKGNNCWACVNKVCTKPPVVIAQP